VIANSSHAGPSRSGASWYQVRRFAIFRHVVPIPSVLNRPGPIPFPGAVTQLSAIRQQSLTYKTVSPKRAVRRESVTQRTGYSGASGYESQHKSLRQIRQTAVITDLAPGLNRTFGRSSRLRSYARSVAQFR
jgi:hypothetical protein